jgi:hypothetical protein
MTDQLAASEIRDQFERVFIKFRQVVTAFPETEWRQGESAYQRPAGLAAHFLNTIDYYASGLTAEQFPWIKRLGVDWEDPRTELLPSQQMILDNLAEMEARVVKWSGWTEILAADTLHPYSGKTTLGRAIYLLRHCESHLAELNLELRRRGLLGSQWR